MPVKGAQDPELLDLVRTACRGGECLYNDDIDMPDPMMNIGKKGFSGDWF